MVASCSPAGQCPNVAFCRAGTAAPSGVAWLTCYSARGMLGMGSHSPAKNIIR
jgi:hypothetical protein